MTKKLKHDDATWFDALKWRCIGPPRGGRVVAVAGDPKDAMTFYFGACAGGIWKTNDGGVYWRCVSDGFLKSAAIGAISVAQSDSNVVYAGTGETTIRVDVSYGDGVYKSTDAGRTWKSVGLKDTRHIGRICIHPQNPDLVYVAALGDAFAPNQDRGVFRSSDGGESWEKILYQGKDAGAVDLSIDPNNPRILFAAFWHARRSFWHLKSGGPGSGLFRSMDGGDTWKELSGLNGLPGGLLGKHGVSVSSAQAGRVYALVEAEGDKTGLYRSDDYGDNWILVSNNRDLMHRPWYYTHVFSDTGQADTVYVTNLQMWKSTDGGRSFVEVTTPHGDNHDLWIDQNNPNRMVQGNDGGACVSFNAGLTWSSIYNQNTAQFYRLDVDNQFPYRVYGTQQDNTSISVPSASEWGTIGLGDCSYPGTGESGFIAVHPKDPNIVYCGAVGSSPGGAGALQRYDHLTKQIRLVNVWPESSRGIAPRDLKYRFAWTFPLVFSPSDPKTLYAGGNRVFRTQDEGSSWTAISPDLSLNEPNRQGHSGGEFTHDTAGAEVHATCACVAPSVHRENEIWASTDDGLVHVTRDSGKTWKNVTPKDMPKLAYVGCIEISQQNADTIYVSATRYKLGDYSPYLFLSKNGGKSWSSIVGDLATNEIVRVVRADPHCQGLLFIGTETGLFYSQNDGKNWRRMKGAFPTVPVYDIKIKNSDLVVATHGRSFWILDDFSPLREIKPTQNKIQIFTPKDTVRTRLAWSAGSSFTKEGINYGPAFGIGGASEMTVLSNGKKVRRYLDVGENPPNGALIHYFLPADFAGEFELSIFDSKDRLVKAYKVGKNNAVSNNSPTATIGLNRFVWNLKHQGPTTLDASLDERKNKPLAQKSDEIEGPTVAPGRYAVVLQSNGTSIQTHFNVLMDPRLKIAKNALEKQLALLQKLYASLSNLNVAVNQMRQVKRRLLEIEKNLTPKHATLKTRSSSILEKLKEIEISLIDPKRESHRDVLRHSGGLSDSLTDLISLVSIGDEAPTSQAIAVSQEVIDKVNEKIASLESILKKDLISFRATLMKSDLTTLESNLLLV